MQGILMDRIVKSGAKNYVEGLRAVQAYGNGVDDT